MPPFSPAPSLLGDGLLHRLGITLAAFRIAGGLMLFAVASEMVFGVRNEQQSKLAEDAIEEHVRHVAAFPHAIALMAGPGAIPATLLLAGKARGQWLWLLGVIGIVAVVIAACLGGFLVAGRIARLLGVTGNVVLSRLLGALLAALAVQFVIDGVRAVLGYLRGRSIFFLPPVVTASTIRANRPGPVVSGCSPCRR